MEQKRPSSNRPELARLALKRVAVPVSASAPPSQRAVVAEADAAVREALVAMIPADQFQVSSFEDGASAWAALQAGGVELVVLDRVLPGVAGTTICERVRKGVKGETVAIVLVGTAYLDPFTGAGELNAFGADAFLPLPASAELVEARLEMALARREPIERLGVMPPDLARRLDRLFSTFEGLTYYELLEIPADADARTLQRAFHERSLVFHPDRHARLKREHPHAWERVNAVFKRISEAYQVLSDEATRRKYNLALHRGARRLETDPMRDREQRELLWCRNDNARAAVLESLELRALGDLEGAADAMERAVLADPGNENLAKVSGALQKLVSIMNR